MSASRRMHLSKDERSAFDKLRPSVEGLTTSEVSKRLGRITRTPGRT